jgi:hypothetical protein
MHVHIHCSTRNFEHCLRIYLGTHVSSNPTLHTTLEASSFLILVSTHVSMSIQMFASVKTLNSFLLKKFRNYLHYWKLSNNRNILENWHGIWNFECPKYRCDDIKMRDFRFLRQLMMTAVFRDVMPTNLVNINVTEDSAASSLISKYRQLVPSRCQYLSSTLHDTISQKNATLI